MSGGGARGLRRARVRQVMSAPLVTCTPELPIEDVAALMTSHRVHSVVVVAPAAEGSAPAHRRWGVISDLDLAAAGPWGEGLADAGSVAVSPPAVVRPDDTLAGAALLMAEYATAHLLVVEQDGDAPIGIVSALDVATALARATDERPQAAGPRVDTSDEEPTHCEWCGAEYPLPRAL